MLNRSGTVEQQQHFTDMLGLGGDGDSDGDGLRGRERNCVKLRGLPWSASPEEIIKFFGELKDDICTHGVHMVLNAMVSVFIHPPTVPLPLIASRLTLPPVRLSLPSYPPSLPPSMPDHEGYSIVVNSSSSSVQNRPTGDCYVQLKSVDAASRASEQLHKQYIGNRYIEVFQVGGGECGRGGTPFQNVLGKVGGGSLRQV